MGGGFGSKTNVGAEGLICARLAQEAKAPVKLMLDRKEEQLAVGNRPSAIAHIRAGVSADGTSRGVRRSKLGHGRRGRDVELPAAVHLQLPEPPAHAQGRLHQRRPAARDAGAGPSTGMLPHRNPDGRARGSRPDGSGRVPDQEPPRQGRERDVGGRTSTIGAKAFGWDKRHADGRRAVGSDQDRHGLRRAPLGRRRPRIARALRHHVRRQRGDEVRHAGSRHRHPDHRRRWSPPRRSVFRSARSRRKSATRSIRSAARPAAARRPRA